MSYGTATRGALGALSLALALALPLIAAGPAAADRWHDDDRSWYRDRYDRDPWRDPWRDHRRRPGWDRHHRHDRDRRTVVIIQEPAPPPVVVQPPAVVAPAPSTYCREYTSTATVGGRPVETYGTACRQPDGSWKIVSSNPVP